MDVRHATQHPEPNVHSGAGSILSFIPFTPLSPSPSPTLCLFFDCLTCIDHSIELLQVEQFRNHPAILSWYIADEPDGAGSSEGQPIGIPVADVRAAYELVRSLDPYHPVSLVLNCKYSAPLYADATDILMVDPYPVSINTTFCSESYGCCGCDDCSGKVADVSERMDFTASMVAYRSRNCVTMYLFANGR